MASRIDRAAALPGENNSPKKPHAHKPRMGHPEKPSPEAWATRPPAPAQSGVEPPHSKRRPHAHKPSMGPHAENRTLQHQRMQHPRPSQLSSCSVNCRSGIIRLLPLCHNRKTRCQDAPPAKKRTFAQSRLCGSRQRPAWLASYTRCPFPRFWSTWPASFAVA